MQDFNLIDHPWIPVRWQAGADRSAQPTVSLHDAFAHSAEIADLDCAPHERIAITRLLVCIAHAALGAPENPADWDGFGVDLDSAIPAYLGRPDIHQHFNLLGDGPRFLQEMVSTSSETVPSSKLFPQLATGNNPTVLDHAGNSKIRRYGSDIIAVGLLTFQNFYPLYGAGFKGRGPCADGNAIHCLLLASSLGETVRANMLDLNTLSDTALEGLGKPIWECKNAGELDASTRTLLGRLVPRHRALRLTDDLTGFHHQKKSLIYPNWEPHREPSMSILVTKKDERKLTAARIERGIWRDLHNLIALRSLGSASNDPARVLVSHAGQLDAETVALWTGALVTDFKAKILDTTESTFTLSRDLFGIAGRHLYGAGVDHAEEISRKLYGAIRSFGSALSHEAPPVQEGQKHYWHRLDQEHRVLIHLAASPKPGRSAIGLFGAEDDWTKLVREAAFEAYAAVCARTTPRQIQAYTAGIRSLHSALYPKPKKESQPATT